MRISLPLKLAVFVVALFALVIATCLLWTPVKIKWYTRQLASPDAGICAAAMEKLHILGKAGQKAVIDNIPLDCRDSELLLKIWGDVNREINDREALLELMELSGAARETEDTETEWIDLNGHNCTLLHLASAKGNLFLVKLLLVKGAKLDLKSWFSPVDKDGFHHPVHEAFTPLHLAALHGHKEIVELLIEKGADVNYSAGYNICPLHLAAKGGSREIIEILIGNGADINAGADSGYQPLRYAIAGGHKSIVEYLISRGNNPDVEYGEGYGSLVGFAEARGFNEIASLLRSHGARTGKELRKEHGKKGK
jgi:cytohesin